jgi:ABC-type branched-subunit amino acid transport system substrate-binding protein
VAIVTAVLWARFSSARFSVKPSTGADQVTGSERDQVTTIHVAAKGATLQLTQQQQRGKRIYLTGISASGDKLTAVLGNSNTEVPAAALTCANCHRHDGRGKPEGGIFPSNIRWDELTKPYGANLPRGQSRPPYDESLLKRGITMGLDPAGKRLDDAMPRYRMTHRDLADLVAYLKVLGGELDPGLSADKIRIGVILAPRGQFYDMHLAVRASASAFVAEFNRQGGVYQRDIELCFSEAPARIEDRAAAAGDFVKREQVFALASSFIAGAEGEISQQLGQEGVPLIGAQTLYPQLDFPLNRQLFYLNSGLHGQSLALVRFAQDRRANEAPEAVLLFSQDDTLSDENAVNAGLGGVASTIESGCTSLGWTLQKRAITPRQFSPGLLAQSLAERKIGVVFSLLPAEQSLQLLQSAAAADWFPTCYLPSDIAGRQLFAAPPGFDRRIFLSFSNLPSCHPGGMQAYSTLAQKHELPTAQLAAQFDALAALSTLVQGLQLAAADLSRERLVEQLETLYEYRTGFGPPVTFGPNRRVGARGAYIVTIDLTNQKLVPVSDWIDGSATSRAGL